MGAAIGAALPHTDVEDELVGEVSYSTTDELGARALDLIDQGKETATEFYEKAAEVASDAHDAVKDRVVAESTRSRQVRRVVIAHQFKSRTDSGAKSPPPRLC